MGEKTGKCSRTSAGAALVLDRLHLVSKFWIFILFLFKPKS